MAYPISQWQDAVAFRVTSVTASLWPRGKQMVYPLAIHWQDATTFSFIPFVYIAKSQLMDHPVHYLSSLDQIYSHSFPYILHYCFLKTAYPFFLTTCQMLFNIIAVTIFRAGRKIVRREGLGRIGQNPRVFLLSVFLSGAYILGNCMYLFFDVVSMHMIKVLPKCGLSL